MIINIRGTAAAFLPVILGAGISSAFAVPVPGGTLDPLAIPKYATPLVIPPVLFDDGGAPMTASIALSEFQQQVLPNIGCTAASAAQIAAGGQPIACIGDAFPATTLWGYGDPARPGSVATGGSFSNPALSMEITKDQTTTVTWINDLVDTTTGNYLQHIIQDAAGNPLIDQTLHWAAPNGADICEGALVSDCRGIMPVAALPYTGPIPMVTHVHGAHVGPVSDGYPEAWWLPAANNIPAGYASEGTFYGDINGGAPDTGSAVYQYTNDQPSTTLWYHDHSLGITRLNVYAAGAGFWLIRDDKLLPDGTVVPNSETGLVTGVLPGPPAGLLDDPAAPAVTAIREIPLAIQPKSFNADGSQFFPADRAFFEALGTGQLYADNTGVNIPFLPQGTSDIAPVWNPEAFFNTMVVNGKTWPVLAVAPERYRFRVLNAADSRFLNLSLQAIEQTVKPNGKVKEKVLGEVPIYQIGSEQSLLPAVVRIDTGFATPLPGTGLDVCTTGGGKPKGKGKGAGNTPCVNAVPGTFAEQALLVGPAERADVIVDFSAIPAGTNIVRMINTAPDAPFGGFPDVPADPATTGQVMQFTIDPLLANPAGDPSTAPAQLVLWGNPQAAGQVDPALQRPPGNPTLRDLALIEEESALLCVTVDAVTGVINLDPNSTPPACDPVLGSLPFAPKAAVLGINGSLGAGGATITLWDDPIETNPQPGDLEIWELHNLTVDAHPIHLHLVKFEVIERQIIGGAVRPREPWEAGWKDTVIAYPGEITRIKALFDMPGLYVWHCHILSHEDNEMMVPYCVGTPGVDCPSVLF